MNATSETMSPSKVKQKLKCPQDGCLASFSNSKSLKAHVIAKHSRWPRWRCDKCDFTCASRSSLQRHVESLHAKPNSCTICNRIYGSKGALSHHTRIEHSGFSRLPCPDDDCVSTFKRPCDLKSHVIAKHSR